MTPTNALVCAAIGAVLGAALTWSKPGERAPWSQTHVVGGAYRGQEIVIIASPARVRLAAAIAWGVIVVSCVHAAMLALEMMSTTITTSGGGDCATFPCDSQPRIMVVRNAPPEVLLVDLLCIIATGTFIGALGSWAMHAPHDSASARRISPLVASAMLVVLALARGPVTPIFFGFSVLLAACVAVSAAFVAFARMK